jgi:hypothetical protein
MAHSSWLLPGRAYEIVSAQRKPTKGAGMCRCDFGTGLATCHCAGCTGKPSERKSEAMDEPTAAVGALPGLGRCRCSTRLRGSWVL